MRVAVIGGGPSGLVTLKYLCEAQHFLGCERVEAVLFEDQTHIGGTFFARAYEDAELVSSKQLTSFSDFRCNIGKDFLAAPEYVEYLHRYCDRFDLWPRIKLNAKVVSVRRGGYRGHVITYQRDGRLLEWRCDAVAVCSGLHVEPNIPDIRGVEHIPRVMHSSQFKARKQFNGCKTVMVVGCGETGADVAYLAATHPDVDRVILCHRDGFHFAPKRNAGPVLLPILGRKPDPAEPGIPIDVSRANLFDTAYVHQILRHNDKLLWTYYHLYIKSLLWLSSGTTAGMDQWVCPYISLPYRPQVPGPRLWLYALRSALVQIPVMDTEGRCVDLAPWPRRFLPSGLTEFVDNGRPEYQRLRNRQIRPDVVVLCTGYQQSFPFFDSQSNPPYQTPDRADVRRIWARTEPSISFIGFVRPSLGAIPPLAEMQAQLWITHLLARHKVPRSLRLDDEPHYRLRSVSGARVLYGVDYESYVYQLALDMDAAPGLIDIVCLGSLKLFLIWALGANFNTKFRLRGPWKWKGAHHLLVSDEFWDTIKRRPIIFGHFAVSILPMLIFGPISFACFLANGFSVLLRLAPDTLLSGDQEPKSKRPATL
ncbi:hypothetical protein LMH87_001467 [Akanthomyces muscarius]|uniref:Dimethylaniline monooxygenase n=1 Tax=Akanthomyces muscarius TaxID=2231603 RepID=A0A9W8Q7M7_AKAMU|nr:hypothetical protein LMH87_001467 [Akanthomyces muscarius]KAJ4146911.1 hypothetical protein LMH87_001467 [Akanthomyces muscarius]